jgi:hypothetical protein
MLGFAFVVVCQLPGFGQNRPEPDHDSAKVQRSLLGKAPSRGSCYNLELQIFNRTLTLCAADQTGTSQEDRALYFHSPLFAIQQPPTPLNGYPSIVWSADPTASGGARLVFRFVISTDELRRDGRDEIVERHAQDVQGGQLDKVVVSRFPLTHLVVDCRERYAGPILASGQTSSLINNGDAVEVALDFAPEQLATFFERADTGGVEFGFRYTFENRQEQRSSESIKAYASFGTKVRSLLTSEQRESSAPIFNRQRVEVSRELSAHVIREVRSQNPDHMPTSMQDKIMSELFVLDKEQLFSALDTDKALRDAVYEYLKPLVQELRSTNTRTNAGSGSGDNSVSLALKQVFDIGLSGKNSYSNQYGVTFVQDETSKWYRLHSIKVYRFAGASAVNSLDASTVYYVSVGSSQDYVEDTPIPSTFTLKVVSDHLKSSLGLPFYAGVPLGTVLPFVGERIPDGYVELDGKSVWPREPWVPNKLQGKDLPNLSGRSLVGGDANSAGDTIVRKTELPIPGLRLPDLQQKRTNRVFYSVPSGFGGSWGSGQPSVLVSKNVAPNEGALSNAGGDSFVAVLESVSSGSATIPTSIPLEDAYILPNSMVVRWIMRVR